MRFMVGYGILCRFSLSRFCSVDADNHIIIKNATEKNIFF